jgi:hypothetical protein
MAIRNALGQVLIGAVLLTQFAHAACDSTQPSRTPTARYVIDSAKGEVYDRKTDLTWQRCSLGQKWKADVGCVGVVKQITWDEAMQSAANGWRMPDKDELSTLLAPTCKNPAINEEAFPDMDLGKLWYWSSSPGGDYLAWLANFADGNFTSYDRTDVGAVRLVRSSQ